VQIIASVDAGGRSTSQHSQLGRSSSTPQLYLMMTAGTHQPPCHHSEVPRRSHGRALSASAADVRQPMRGLYLLLRHPPRCFAAQPDSAHFLSRFRIRQCSESVGV
jgi:hypothetical protein